MGTASLDDGDGEAQFGMVCLHNGTLNLQDRETSLQMGTLNLQDGDDELLGWRKWTIIMGR